VRDHRVALPLIFLAWMMEVELLQLAALVPTVIELPGS
jgi:hypothetical protein